MERVAGVVVQTERSPCFTKTRQVLVLLLLFWQWSGGTVPPPFLIHQLTCQALHRTSDGEVRNDLPTDPRLLIGEINIQAETASLGYDHFLPEGSALRALAFRYYRRDFEMLAAINIPPFNNSRYKRDLEEMEAVLGVRAEPLAPIQDGRPP